MGENPNRETVLKARTRNPVFVDGRLEVMNWRRGGASAEQGEKALV
jgi:hypothetical protein